MRLVTFRFAGSIRPGIVLEDGIHEISNFPSVKAAIGRVDEIKWSPRAATSLAEADLLPPVPDSGKIICVGLNYHAHREESRRPEIPYPTLFTRWADTQVGHGKPLVRPSESKLFDYEGELAAVIGKPGYRIPESDALSHVAGYSCYNDGSVRDWQNHSSQFTPGKNFPASGGFGPWLVVDEIDDPASLTLTTYLNDEVVQQSGTDALIFTVPFLIAYISRFTALETGDLIVTGTPGGVGHRREPPRYLQPGDVVEVEVTRVGRLSNPVVDG